MSYIFSGKLSAGAMQASIEEWRGELSGLHQGRGELFARSEVGERGVAYGESLLSSCERKDIWQVAGWAGEASPYGMRY